MTGIPGEGPLEFQHVHVTRPGYHDSCDFGRDAFRSCCKKFHASSLRNSGAFCWIVARGRSEGFACKHSEYFKPLGRPVSPEKVAKIEAAVSNDANSQHQDKKDKERNRRMQEMINKEIDEATQILRSVSLALHARLPDDLLMFSHTKGHAGQFWNEMVDRLATLAQQRLGPDPAIAAPPPQWKEAAPHLWTLLQTDWLSLDLERNTACFHTPPLPQKSCQPLHQGDHQPQRIAEVSLNVASANVLSLYSGDGGGTGKVAYLQAQFDEAKLHIVGLQETRGKDGCWETPRWIRLTAGDLKGSLGIELWISKSTPYAVIGRQSLFFRKSHVAVVDKSPRHLLARIDAPAFSTWVLVAHAPHGGHTEAQRMTWWEDMSTLLRRHQADGNCLVCIDANATSGPRTDFNVFAADDAHDHSSRFFQNFLRSANLCLPATDPTLGDWHHTWTSPDGQVQKRIDFVCVHWLAHHRCVEAFVCPEIDLNFHDRDHILTGLRLTWQAQCKRCSFLDDTKPLAFHREAIQADDTLGQDLLSVSATPWRCDVDTQHSQINAQVQQVLARRFPPPKRGPKKPYLTEEIWSLRGQVLQARKQLKRMLVERSAMWLRHTFQCWKRASGKVQPAQDDASAPLPGCPFLLKQIVTVRTLASQLKKSVKRSKLASLTDALASCTPDMPASDVLRKLRPFRGSSNSKFFGPTPLPMVNSKDGKPCASVKAVQDRWIEFFAEMEGGVRQSAQDIRDEWIQCLTDTVHEIQDGDLADVPALVHLEQSMRRVSMRKAVGPDHIPGEICHLAPDAMAELYFPLLVKMVVFGMEPVEFKGGRLTMAWKRKGPQSECSSYRSLLVSSHPGKACHRALRDLYAPAFASALTGDQFGGRKGISVTLAMHVIRAHQRLARAANRSSAVIFLDLQEAFYRTLRELAVGSNPSSQLQSWIEGLGLPPDAYEDLVRHLEGPPATALAGMTPITQRLARILHQNTWFFIAGQQDRVATSIGSRPGDCFADWVFSVLFSRVMQPLRSRLQHLGLLDDVTMTQTPDVADGPAETSGAPTVGPVWMDDLAIPVHAGSSHELIRKVCNIVAELIHACRSHGMTPSFKEGKSEVLMDLRGDGSHEWRKKLFNVGGDPYLDVLVEDGIQRIHVATKYKHLGGTLHHTGTGLCEAKQRFAQAHAAFSEHRKLLFHNPQLALAQKRQLFDSLIMSRLLYGMDSLLLDRPVDQEYLEAALGRLYRRLLKVPSDAHLSREAIRAQLEMLDFLTLHRRSRLRYYGTVFRSADSVVWTRLQRDLEWVRAIREDMQWMRTRLVLSRPLPDPEDDLGPWHDLIRTKPKYWKKLISRAVRAEVLAQKNEHIVASFHQRFGQRLCDLDVMPDLVVPALPAKGHYGCMFCKRSMKSKAGEAAHFFKVHGHYAKVRQLFDSTQCRSCLKEFHTVEKIQRHLQMSRRCRMNLHAIPQQDGPLPGIGSRGDGQLQAKHDQLLPPLQAAGPLPLPQPRHDDDEELLQDLDAIRAVLLSEDVSRNTSQLEEHLRRVIHGRIWSWTRCQRALLRVVDSLTEEDAALTDFSFQELCALLRLLADPGSWDFLQDMVDNVGGAKPSLQQWTAHLHSQARPDTRAQECCVPRAFSKDRVVLHLFSGRRRHGDLQEFMENLPRKDGQTLTVLSIDLVFDTKWGNLADAECQSWWLHSIRQGWIVGLLAGPPCCTWFQARGRIVAGKRHPPRVVRSPLEPWGFQWLAIREWLQVIEGNELLLFVVEAILELWFMGGAAILEHPARPDDPSLVCIWETAPLRVLRSLPGVSWCHISQGHFGAKSAKPTHLLVLNMPMFPAIARAGRLTERLPAGQSIGVSATGEWRTTALKEEPPRPHAPIASRFQLPTHFWQNTRHMQASFGGAMGKDYHG
eukprot:Skav223124  [mRNA]  locus=scaffold419:845478:860783:- [translate_table: standard]